MHTGPKLVFECDHVDIETAIAEYITRLPLMENRGLAPNERIVVTLSTREDVRPSVNVRIISATARIVEIAPPQR